MSNSQMTAQQAAQEVIKLKKEYDSRSKGTEGFHNSSVAKEISSKAEALRNQYGLDSSKYGSGASLADAYMNYHNDFGNSQQPPQRQPQQQTPQQDYRQPSTSMEDILGMLQDGIQSGYESQKSQFDKILEGQLAELDKALADAVAEGEISVKDAEKAFNEQKAEIEKAAYQQADATKNYSRSMGIQNSQQAIGLMQGDNARINNIHNTNMSERDRRIADIKDRVNLIKQKKSIDEARYKAEHGYNLAGAEAQANQMYMQSVADLMGQDYFAQQGYAHDERMFNKQTEHDYNMFDKKAEHEFGIMDKQQEYQRENMYTEFLNKMQLTEFESDLRINEMIKGHELKLDELENILLHDLKKMEVGHGYNVELTNIQVQGQIRAASISANAQLQAARENRQAQLNALKNSVTPGTDEYKAAELEIERQSRMTTNKIMAETRAGIATDVIMSNPNLPQYGSQYDGLPFDFTSPSNSSGIKAIDKFANWATGYDKKYQKHTDTIKAIDAVNRYLGDYNHGVPWATERKK